MKVLVLDDDPQICNLINSLLVNFFNTDFDAIEIATNKKDAQSLLKRNQFDLLLLDVQLNKQATSFELLETIGAGHAKIIFITGHEKYAINAIKAGAVDYILKPIQTDEFRISISKAIDLIRNETTENNVYTYLKVQENALMLKALECMRLVKLNDILYLNACGPYTDIYLKNDEKITVTKHLKDFENKLRNTGFYRIHNSYIINTLKMKQIIKKDGLSVEMADQKHIGISSRRKEDFLNFIKKHLEI